MPATKKKTAKKAKAPTITTHEVAMGGLPFQPEELEVMFCGDEDVINHAGTVTASFKAGETYTLPFASAARWIIRRRAIIAGDDMPEGWVMDADKPKEKPARQMLAARSRDTKLS